MAPFLIKISLMKIVISLCVFLCSFTILGQDLSLDQANHLSSLPFKCLQQEYPNKLNQLLLNESELQSPKDLHPSFYGCFDWHSSVHGHWSLVYLLSNYENLANKDAIIKKLKTNLSKENIIKEIEYFSKAHEKSFERTYGWNWLLKLQLTLEQSNQSEVKELSENLKPLSQLIIQRYIEFLPKLLYPIRVGTHSNTAFGLSNAWDYAVFTNNEELMDAIKQNAIRLFYEDKNCPLNWEPSGTDFLSPCLEEIGLLQRILSEEAFLNWLKEFSPQLLDKNFQWDVARVSDRTDGHLVHLDGLNFSRAWNFYRLANQFPNELGHLKIIATKHLEFSLPSIVDGNYEGEHWLASFALRAFEEKN